MARLVAGRSSSLSTRDDVDVVDVVDAGDPPGVTGLCLV